LGQATVLATTGEITGSARIQVSDMAPPQADFTATPLTGSTPLTVTFTDLSMGHPNAWLWDFGDGTTSEEQHPTHAYVVTGTYAVTLNASNAFGADSLVKPNYITIGGPMALEANFSASPTEGLAPLAVVFTNTSTGDYTQAWWDYGDGQGTIGTLQLLSHVYTAAGSYTVTLSVSDGVITSTLTRPSYIEVMEGTYLPIVFRSQ
jgi:PKD repeat protein